MSVVGGAMTFARRGVSPVTDWTIAGGGWVLSLEVAGIRGSAVVVYGTMGLKNSLLNYRTINIAINFCVTSQKYAIAIITQVDSKLMGVGTTTASDSIAQYFYAAKAKFTAESPKFY